jgi:hypothetical protein
MKGRLLIPTAIPRRRSQSKLRCWGLSTGKALQLAYHAIGGPSRKKPLVGPSDGRVAAQTTPEAPSLMLRVALGPPMSVFTHPGQTELTKMP